MDKFLKTNKIWIISIENIEYIVIKYYFIFIKYYPDKFKFDIPTDYLPIELYTTMEECFLFYIRQNLIEHKNVPKI